MLVENTVRFHDIDEFQLVALSHSEVIGIMRRRDLHRPGPKFGIDKFIADHFDLPINKRQYQCLADIFFVPFVLRIDRNRRVTQHGFRTGGGHNNKLIGIVFERITQVIQIALQFAMFGLFIGKGRLAARAPVDDILALIDQAFLIQTNKYAAHRLTVTFVHRKARARPITGRP